MSEITCDEMLELASLGAKVLHPRAVEIARNYGVSLVVRSSWTDDPGTRVISPTPRPRSLVNLEIARPVHGVEIDTDQAKVALLRVPDRPGVAAQLFGEIARQNLDVDLIIQSIHEGNTNDIAFTVNTPILNRAEAVAAAIAPVLRSGEHSQLEEAEVIVQRQIAKVSIAGAGMIGRPGVAAQMFATLWAAGINIQMISTSEVKVSCVIDVADSDRAVAALCQAFELSQDTISPASAPVHLATTQESKLTPLPSTSVRQESLQQGELPEVPIKGNLSYEVPIGGNLRSDFALRSDFSAPTTSPLIPVRGVALDLNQARLAIRYVPDRPGMAARLFGILAQHNISVDMIIQSQRCRVVNSVPTRDIAFTVAQVDATAAQAVLSQAAAELEWGAVVVDSAIAKVSIVGAGMVGQPGIAARMFEALAQQQINIQMIATSEIKISCVVAQEDGARALTAIHAAFELAGDQKIQVPA